MTSSRETRSGNPVRLLLHVPVPWVFVLTYLVGAAVEYVRPVHAPRLLLGEATVAGAVLLLVGAVIAGSGLLLFHRVRTTTVPGKVSATLVTWGPYRFTRNPMYVGLVLAYLGEAALLKQVWPVVLLPVTVAYVNWIVIPLEEAKLADVFRDEYAAYRSRVRRWI